MATTCVGNQELTVAAVVPNFGRPICLRQSTTQVSVAFTVFNASPTETGDYIFLTGNTVELGNWTTTWDGATGPMLAPNYPNCFLNVSVPAGQTIQFKFIKIAANGAVTWEAGANHTYTVPPSGVGHVNVNWQY